jgi:hypothetical protein
MQLEQADQKWVDEKLRLTEDAAERGDGGEPPILGSERPDSNNGGGGAGNLIFFNFTDTTSSGVQPTGKTIRKFGFDEE